MTGLHRVVRHLLPLGLLAVVVLGSAGCSQKSDGAAGGAGAGQKRGPVPVVVTKAEQTDVPVEIRAIGTVEAIQSAPVRAQVGGLLTAVRFREGEMVKAGQVLFEIDARPIESTIKQLEANLVRDEAQARNAEAQARAMEAQLRTAEAQIQTAEAQARYADEQAKRYQDLVEKEYVTREQYDQLRTNAEAAQSALSASRSSKDASRANIDAVRASIDATRASIAATKAAIENAKVQLSYTVIRSPISGQAGDLMAKMGDLVKANDTAPLVTVNQIHPILVRFPLPEAHLPDVQKYRQRGTLKARVELPGNGAGSREGSVVFLDNSVDRTSGTITLKAQLENQDSALWPGQFVNVALVLYTREDAVVVPAPAVQVGQQGTYLFVLDAEGTADLRKIVVGATADGRTIIEEGVKPGETVVTDGQLRLTPGAKGQPKAAPGAAASQVAKGPAGPSGPAAPEKKP